MLQYKRRAVATATAAKACSGGVSGSAGSPRSPPHEAGWSGKGTGSVVVVAAVVVVEELCVCAL